MLPPNGRRLAICSSSTPTPAEVARDQVAAHLVEDGGAPAQLVEALRRTPDQGVAQMPLVEDARVHDHPWRGHGS